MKFQVLIATKVIRTYQITGILWVLSSLSIRGGGAEYTSTSRHEYFIDRWLFQEAENSTVQLKDDGLHLSGATNSIPDRYIIQYVELSYSEIKNLTFTFSVLFDFGLESITYTTSGSAFDYRGNASHIGMRSFESGLIGVYIFQSFGREEEVIIKATKLEIGSEQTLAYFDENKKIWKVMEILNYTEQLLRCQRFFQPVLIGGEDINLEGHILTDAKKIEFRYQLSPPLRIKPVIKSYLSSFPRIVDGAGLLGNLDGTWDVMAYDGKNISFNCSYTADLPDRDYHMVTIDGFNMTGGIFFDANL